MRGTVCGMWGRLGACRGFTVQLGCPSGLRVRSRLPLLHPSSLPTPNSLSCRPAGADPRGPAGLPTDPGAACGRRAACVARGEEGRAAAGWATGGRHASPRHVVDWASGSFGVAAPPRRRPSLPRHPLPAPAPAPALPPRQRCTATLCRARAAARWRPTSGRASWPGNLSRCARPPRPVRPPLAERAGGGRRGRNK